MGVHGLWELLAPVGRRVSVEALANKRLAIDASIWIIQFMKAMRDDRGDMIRNAHLLGFFRRICKLLFLRAKPVFVFDGGTPALKRRTVLARRRQRENAQSRVRKTAEKLLLNHLRTRKLEEIAHGVGLPELGTDMPCGTPADVGSSAETGFMSAQMKNLAGVATEPQMAHKKVCSSSEEEFKRSRGRISADIASELQRNQKNVGLSAEEEFTSARMGIATDSVDESEQRAQKHVCSSAEEKSNSSQWGISTGIANESANASKLVGQDALDICVDAAASAHSDSDEDEFFIPPSAEGTLDAEVLASLPPSMQLDLLVQMREQQVTQNRQRFQKVAKEPASFSQLQIQTYLKTVAFRREMNEVQKTVASGDVGIPSARIASETDREFIFSSSFHGEKQALKFSKETTSPDPKVKGGLGIRMTRDLQWNLYLMKDKEAQTKKETQMKETNDQTFNLVSHPGVSSQNNFHDRISNINKQTGLEISFHNDDSQVSDEEDGYLFEALVKGETQMKQSSDQTPNLVSSPRVPSQNNLHGRINNMFCNDNRQASDETERYPFESLVNGEAIPGSGCFEAHERGKEWTCRSTDDNGVEDDECIWEDANVEGNRDKERTCISTKEIGGEEDECIWEDANVEHNRGKERTCISTEENGGEDDECIWEDTNVKHGAAIEDNNVFSVQGQLSEKAYQGLHSETIGSGDKSSAFRVDGTKVGSSMPESGDLSPVAREDGTNVGSSMLASEDIDSYLRDIETAEYEEAIHRSLEDFGHGVSLNGASHLKIEEPSAQGINRTEELTVETTDSKFSDASFLTEAQTRKGKAVVEDYDPKRAIAMEKDECLGDVEHNVGFPTMKAVVSVVNSNIYSNEASVSKIVEKPDSGVIPEPHVATNQMAYGPLNKVTNVQQPKLSNVGYSGNSSIQSPVNPSELSRENFYGEEMHMKTQSIDIAKKSQVLESPRSAQMFQSNLNEIPEDVLIEDAQNFDFSESMKDISEKEAAVYADRQELARQSEVLQANLQAEQEALQARLKEDREMLMREEAELLDAQRKNERNAESVTGEMFSECQELLQMFGLPFIIAPMEAEAQCAYMNITHLVDGVVTDDSDVFLFGGENVFKNIFDDRKYVETYYIKDLEAELGLDREKLIHMALLLGSDYTEGISGIGIVNAIEVVNSFPGENGLKKFKEWLDSPDISLLKNFNSKSSRKVIKTKKQKASQDIENVMNEKDLEVSGIEPLFVEDAENEDCGFQELHSEQHFKEKHRAVSKNWIVPDSFPNTIVISAYKFPQVEKSTEPFSWGRPDLEALRRLCFEKFGWNKDKADELLLPVLKEYDRHEVQLRLEAFYSFNQQFAKIRSKRIQKAVTQITGGKSARLLNLCENSSPSNPSSHREKKEKKQISDSKTTEDISMAKDLSRKGKQGKTSNKSIGKTGGTSKVKHTGRRKVNKVACKGSSDSTDSREEKDDREREQMVGQISTEQQLPRRSSRPHQKATYNLMESDDDENATYPMVASSQAAEIPYEVSTECTTNKLFISTNANIISPVREEEDKGTHLLKGNPSTVPDKTCSDYLATGGGFCFPENQDEECLDVYTSVAGKGVRQDDGSNIMDQRINSAENLLSAAQAACGSTISSVKHGSLRAIPSLKRKKRPSSLRD